MKNLRFIHTADWHGDSEPVKLKKLEDSLKQIVDYCSQVKVNGIIIAGDIWEKKQSYAEKSGVPIVVTYLRHLSKLVDFIFITKGNNSHDEPGSVKLLHQLEPNIYAYEYPVVLGIYENKVDDLLRPNVNGEPIDVSYEVVEDYDYIVSLVPYPQKSGFITNTSIDNNNNEFLEKFEQLFELIGDVTQPYTCPKILAFHGNVVGSRLSSGQSLVSQDIMVAPSSLEKAKADYYALGHIHLRQEIKWNMLYSGSIYNKSWGETELKSFEVVELTDNDGLTGLNVFVNTRQLLSAKPMIKIEAEFDKGEFVFEHDYPAIDKNCEYRLRITVKENDRKLITADKMDSLKNVFGNDIKIELNIIPNERESRSEKIMDCKSLLDEVKEYAEVIEQPINETIENKVFEVQEVEL